jgi:hypothetical protein
MYGGGGGLTTDIVEESHLKAVDAASDEECLTYESTVGDFEWQSCTSTGDNVASNATTDNYVVCTDGTSGAVQECNTESTLPSNFTFGAGAAASFLNCSMTGTNPSITCTAASNTLIMGYLNDTYFVADDDTVDGASIYAGAQQVSNYTQSTIKTKLDDAGAKNPDAFTATWTYTKIAGDDTDGVCDLSVGEDDCFTIPDPATHGLLTCFANGTDDLHVEYFIGSAGETQELSDLFTNSSPTDTCTDGAQNGICIYDSGTNAVIHADLGQAQRITCIMHYDLD